MRGDLLISRRRQPNVASELDFMPKVDEYGDRRARQIGVDWKTHAELGGGQRVKGLLLR